jgi:FeS assembly protein IscX
MPGRFGWQDTEEIALRLLEQHPDTDPFSVRFTELHKWIVNMPGFDDDKSKNAESLLEQIQLKWAEEKRDAENS